LIAFQQNEAGLGGIAMKPGTAVQVYWAEEGNHIVRDEANAGTPALASV